MNFLLARDVYQLKVFDTVNALNILKYEQIKIYNLTKVEKFIYRFESPRTSRKRIFTLFTEIKIIKQVGILARIESLIKSKTTMVAILISLFLFAQLTSRIYVIDIKGDSAVLEPIIQQRLIANGIKFNSHGKNLEKLLEIERTILNELKSEIEYLEIRQTGVLIKVRYQKRRVASELPVEKTSLYASKDTVIKSFSIKKGLKMVNINDYVKKGDILVSDKLIATNGEEIHLGCEGYVMGYTWYNYTVTQEITEHMDDTELYLFLIEKARIEVSKELDEGEYIDSETIISINKGQEIALMRVNYILVENISTTLIQE